MKDKIMFYLLDISYKIINDKAEIHIFGKTQDDKHVIIVDDSFLPYFYVIANNKNNGFEKVEISEITKKIEKLEITDEKENVSSVVKTEIINMNLNGKSTSVIKVYTKLPKDVPIIRKALKEWDLVENTYEYDIEFVRRYLIDKNLTPLMFTQAEGKAVFRNAKAPVYIIDKIEQTGEETFLKPKILGFDIETYSKDGKTIDMVKNPIVMLSFYGGVANIDGKESGEKPFKKVITWKRFKTNVDYIEFVESEAELIQRFKEVIETWLPDMIVGYYSDGFDLPYIQKRADKYKIKLDLGLDYSLLKISKGMAERAKISGLTHIDILNVIKKMFSQSLKTDYYDLNSVSEELLSEGKVDVEMEQLANAWDKDHDKLENFCKYNLQDSKLVYMLAKKIMPNVIEMVKTVGVPIFESTRMGFSQLVEWYLIKQAKSFNEIVPNKPSYKEVGLRRQNRYQGAFVLKPKPGLYENVFVFDFRSLYPTIISSHNISPESLRCSCCSETSEKIPLKDKDYYFCKEKKAFLPKMIEEIINRRTRIKDMMKKEKNLLLDARQNNLKVLANAFYGYYGFFNARWYSIESARSITALGRHYIQNVIEQAKKMDYEVLYSDTDSIFLSASNKDEKSAQVFIDEINPDLPGIMELEYEGFYPRAIFVAAKAGPYGAKKKYAMIDKHDKIHIKGFETVRKNWSNVAKNTQRKIISYILKDNDPKKALKLVKGIIDDLKDKKISIKDLIIRTQLNKDLDNYANIGPHVAIAKKLKQAGENITVGTVIEYVVSEGSGSIGDRAKIPEETNQKNIDASYYIDHQVLPSVEPIFEVLGYSRKDLVVDKKQSTLGSFT